MVASMKLVRFYFHLKQIPKLEHLAPSQVLQLLLQLKIQNHPLR
jgi:hypothetical protein